MQVAAILPARIARSITTIVVHCSATPSGRWLPGTGPGQSATAAGVIDRWHAQRGFQRVAAARDRFNYRLGSIGYHYVVDIDGHVWTGRDVNEIGAHVAGHNAASLGICLVGGSELVARYTPDQWASLSELVRGLKGLLPKARVCGHRDLSPDTDGDGKVERHEWLKTCPGFDVASWLAFMDPKPEHVVHA